MKPILLLFCLTAVACSGSRYGKGVPERYEALLDSTMLRAGDRAGDLRRLLKDTPAAEREGMAFLLAYLPAGDADTMDTNLLRENVRYAYRARDRFPWARNLPDSIFLNEVLPYAVVDEVRSSWRADFYARFAPVVEGCTGLLEAAEAVNRALPRAVDVEYNTLRRKTNQNPAESMQQHMASCTGLSILLVDALRAVGIPARFAGTPAWHDDRGNHSWTEVWSDGAWHFTEYYFAGFDDAWFLADAARARPGDRAHAVYAVSFRPTGDRFPMVWSEEASTVHGVEVTARYVGRYRELAEGRLASGSHTPVTLGMWRDAAHSTRSNDRVAANVDVFCDGQQVAGGRTAGPRQDMNDVLTFLLEKGRTYAFRYENARGELAETTAYVGDDPVAVVAYMR